MDLRQLAALNAVGDHHGFSAAARALHTVQSNVSAHVARLEAELGTTLVDRSKGVLTPAGEQVVARARRIQAELDAVAGDVASITRNVTGPVRLGMIGTTARWLAPLLLPSVHALHEGIHLILVDATTTSLLPQLHTRQLDLAVVNLPVSDPDLRTEHLFDEEQILVAPVGHPLADRESVDLADLAAHELLLPPPGTAFRDALDAETNRHDVTLRAAAEIDGMRLLATLAFEGFGAAVLPASAAPGRPSSNWHRVTISGLAPRSVGLAWDRRILETTAAGAVREILCDVVDRDASRHLGITGRVRR